jgi:transposase
MSRQWTAEVLLLDGDTIRTWYQHNQEDGIEGLASFGHEGGSCWLTTEQKDKLKAWIATTLPRSTRAAGARIAAECAIEYQTRSNKQEYYWQNGSLGNTVTWHPRPSPTAAKRKAKRS